MVPSTDVSFVFPCSYRNSSLTCGPTSRSWTWRPTCMRPSGSSPSSLPSSPCAWCSTSLTCCCVRYVWFSLPFFWDYSNGSCPHWRLKARGGMSNRPEKCKVVNSVRGRGHWEVTRERKAHGEDEETAVDICPRGSHQFEGLNQQPLQSLCILPFSLSGVINRDTAISPVGQILSLDLFH